jgi:hypothetical protein
MPQHTAERPSGKKIRTAGNSKLIPYSTPRQTRTTGTECERVMKEAFNAPLPKL